MNEHKLEGLKDVIRTTVATFIEAESNKQSLITITNVDLTRDFKTATLFVTVFPEHKEQAAIDFLHRKGTEVRNQLKKHTRLPVIPHVDFEIDKGEKSRQRLDELSREIE